uniref:Uncharacterized protein n=1 Tax=Mucochytrium quahogii TaxID=96639 RepID=A0A7S2SGJ2_9STRA|mmetsp:Transcript_19954/g.32889  ORF Transcript_19954/g.32889 Transcript_19954/m.32889 type:complete len:293 (+) Transcript_19954:179-1057(+)
MDAAIWVAPLLTLEFVGVTYYVYVWVSKRKSLKDDNAHALKTCGTIFDPRPESAEDETAVLGEIPFGHKVLAVSRTAVFAFMVGIQIHVYITSRQKGQQFLFFTIWTYHLEIVFYACAVACSWFHLTRRGVPEKLLRLTNLLYAIALPMSLLVSIVYWCILVPQALSSGETQAFDPFSFEMFAQHAINTVCFYLEFIFNRFQVHDHHLLAIILYTMLYCGFIWVQHLITKFWPYFFLKLTPAAFAWYNLVFLFHFVIFKLVHCLSKIKQHKFDLSNRIHLEESQEETSLLDA